MEIARTISIPKLRVPESLRQVGLLMNEMLCGAMLHFRPVTPEAMSEIWPILKNEPGRTTDFSYAGLLMWVDYFKYEYAIVEDTLFIKGLVEDDITKPAFSLPVGPMPLSRAIQMIISYCRINGISPELSAVPEYAIEDLRALGAKSIDELEDWADYLYEADKLASLSGKKLGKKRNHVNKFNSLYPDWKLEPLTAENAADALVMMDAFEQEADDTEMAAVERNLSRRLIQRVAEGDLNLEAAILRVGDGTVCAYTIGDIKGDTLFIHVEKALRGYDGSYEMINNAFAKDVCTRHPEIRFINREDAAGDEGLKRAKESYHPVDLLRKYNVIF